jgi:hypothetical protein
MDQKKETSEKIFFPFIGLLENGETFEYLLLDANNDYATIAIVNWLVNRTFLNNGDIIQFYTPYESTIYKQLVNEVRGTVISAQNDEKIQGMLYQVSILK